MKSSQNLSYVLVFLIIAALSLAACERPLPGGYNDPYAGPDSTEPEVPATVPEVDSEAYPAEETVPEEAAPVEAAPEDSEAYPAEETVIEQEAATGDETSPEDAEQETGQSEAEAETPDADAPVDEATPSEGEVAEGEAGAEASANDSTGEIPSSHTVVAGENLYRIGLLYGISWLDLAEANGITEPTALSVGQVLIIPVAGGEAADTEAEVPEEEPSEEAAEETESAETTETETASGPITYIVQEGDNLFRIGLNFGVDWTEIVAANNIVDNAIQPGQELIIPAPSEGEAEDVEAAEAAEVVEDILYEVQEGDTIYSVAFLHNIPWTTLVEANDIAAPYTLEIGQSLVIPAGE